MPQVTYSLTFFLLLLLLLIFSLFFQVTFLLVERSGPVKPRKRGHTSRQNMFPRESGDKRVGIRLEIVSFFPFFLSFFRGIINSLRCLYLSAAFDLVLSQIHATTVNLLINRTINRFEAVTFDALANIKIKWKVFNLPILLIFPSLIYNPKITYLSFHQTLLFSSRTLLLSATLSRIIKNKGISFIQDTVGLKLFIP